MFYCENIVEQKNKKSEKLTCLLLEKKHHIKKIDKYILFTLALLPFSSVTFHPRGSVEVMRGVSLVPRKNFKK